MNTVQVFDKTGCCGSSNETFLADIDWAKQNGAKIERYTLADQESAFSSNATVKNFIENSGKDALPLFLINGEIVLSGRHPNREELADLVGISSADAQARAEEEKAAGCCSGGNCA